MYVIRLTCVTIATRIIVNTLTLCYSIWAAGPNTVTLYGYQMLMQVDTLNTLFACQYGNELTFRYHNSFSLLT